MTPLRHVLRLVLLRTIGVAAGRLLQLWFTLPGRRASRKVSHNAPRQAGLRLLVIRPDHLGDVLLTTPALRLLHDYLPGAEITYLVGPWASDALQGNPDVNRIIRCPFPGFVRRHSTSTHRWFRVLAPYILLIHYAALLRRTGPYDAALVLRDDHWWGAILTYLAGIPCRIGMYLPESAPFLTHTTVPAQLAAAGVAHRAEQNIALALQLAGCVSEPHQAAPVSLPAVVEHYRALGLRAVVSDADEQAAANLLASHDIAPSRHLIALQAGTGAALKRWSAAGFAQVAMQLAQEYNATIILVGTSEEGDLTSEIALLAARLQPAPQLVVLAGETTWGVLGAVLKHCALVIGVDSGTLHLAVAVGRPSLALFGPIDPAAFGPWGDPHQATANRHAVVAADLPCRPCRRLDFCALQPTGGPLPVPCMASISPSLVLTTARRLISPTEHTCADHVPVTYPTSLL